MSLVSGRFIFALVLLRAVAWTPDAAQEPITIVADEATADFPNYIDFRLRVRAPEPIIAAELSYGSQALTCGPVTTIGRPEFEPAADLSISWRWPVAEGDIMPPGAQFTWSWRLTTAGGEIFETPRRSAAFEDRWFVWQSLEQQNVTVHWYRGDQALAQEMLGVAHESLQQMARDTGLNLEESVGVYLYDEPAALRVSVPGAPGWIGGIAFPEHSIVLLVASADYLPESARILRHELGHLVFTRLTFNCAATPPTWLAEGLAMNVEGPDEAALAATLVEAIDEGRLLTLAQLEGSFSVHHRPAGLAYAQSHSLVKYLIDRYGRDQLADLMDHLAAGEPFDAALLATYGLSDEALEDDWRAAIGAPAIEAADQADETGPTPVPTLAVVAPAGPGGDRPQATATVVSLGEAQASIETPLDTATPAARLAALTPATAAPETVGQQPEDIAGRSGASWLPFLIAAVVLALLAVLTMSWRRAR